MRQALLEQPSARFAAASMVLRQTDLPCKPKLRYKRWEELAARWISVTFTVLRIHTNQGWTRAYLISPSAVSVTNKKKADQKVRENWQASLRDK